MKNQLGNRLLTLGALMSRMFRRHKLFFIPFVLVLFLAGVLLAFTGGLSVVGPFVYSLF